MPDMNADTVMSMRYFTVFFDDIGITRVNIDRVSTVTEEEARTFAEEITSRERRSGFIDTYRYRMTEHREFGGRIVFAIFPRHLITYSIYC